MADKLDRKVGYGSQKSNSSAASPTKKGGAGAFAWGTAMDGADFVPTNSIGAGVVMAPAVYAAPVLSAGTTAFKMDNSAFPVLGSGTVSLASTSWGPKTVTTAAPAPVRAVGDVVVGAGYPRNQFVKKAHVRPQTQVVSQAMEGTIDWNATGMPLAAMQSIINSNAAAAHLGPYQSAAPVKAVPMDTLLARNAGSVQQYVSQAPKIMNTGPAISGPRVIQQPGVCNRR